MEHLRQRPASLLDALGLQRNPTKGFREPCQFGMHLGSAATYNGGHRSPVSPTASLCTDSSGYGWGGVLNGMLEAQGFRSLADERQHIIWEELKAVRLVVENFLPHLAGRDVLLHKDNKAMQQSGVAASVVTPRWEGKAWHHALAEMAVEELTVAPHAGLFRPGRRNGRDYMGFFAFQSPGGAWARAERVAPSSRRWSRTEAPTRRGVAVVEIVWRPRWRRCGPDVAMPQWQRSVRCHALPIDPHSVMCFVPQVCFTQECQERADREFLLAIVPGLMLAAGLLVALFRPAPTGGRFFQDPSSQIVFEAPEKGDVGRDAKGGELIYKVVSYTPYRASLT
eukprot:jgi/Tetstr1/446442/TSEL_033984.t1